MRCERTGAGFSDSETEIEDHIGENAKLPHIAVWESLWSRVLPDAGGGGRTRTVSLPTDFEYFCS